jgi:colicin import membrane protein
MPRKLKTFQTSLGFYDLAIAAPSMKAALEAWGAGSNLFHQGVAKETDDPDVVAATMSKPSVVLKRSAGSNGCFAEHSELPSELGGDEVRSRRDKKSSKPQKRPLAKIGEAESSQAALAFEKEQRRREAERRREEAVRAKEREKREKAVAKAEAALQKAESEHDEEVTALEAQRDAIDERLRAENDRWEKRKEKLEAALRRARE